MGKSFRRNRRARARRGMSLLEVLVSISVLVIGLAGFLQTIVTTSSMESTTSDHSAAAAAARAAIENMRSTPFDEVFARYNSDADDDLAGANPGAFFTIDGLRQMPGAPAGQVGEIVMPVDAAAPGVLREDLVAEALGFPADLDLNADGDTLDVDNTADYRLLPVIVRVSWESRRGPQVFELRTILGELQ
jgi:prepilin-type N-terminal cleavage/methylation domain-containing protein